VAEVQVVELEVTKSSESCSSVMGLFRSCALLAVLIAPAAVAVAALANRGFSSQSLEYASIAGGICWVAAALALAATFFGNQYRAPVQGVLAGMAFRMGLPLAAVIVLPTLGGPLAAGGMTMTILGVYLVALVIETLLALRLVPPQSSPRQTAPKAA
jgi:hypothetical protein